MTLEPQPDNPEPKVWDSGEWFRPPPSDESDLVEEKKEVDFHNNWKDF